MLKNAINIIEPSRRTVKKMYGCIIPCIMNKIGSEAAGGCKVLVIIIIAVAKPTASANDHHDVPNN